MAGPVDLTATGLENEAGEVKVLGQSAANTRRLAALQKLAASGQVPEAVAEYIRLLEDAGNEMAPLDTKHCIQLRWLAHRALLSLRPSAVQLYRERIDEKIKRWWREAETSRDELLLRRIVNEAFCSSYAGRALDLLGDIAFERGDLDEAEHWWQRIVPLSGCNDGGSLRLVLPDANIDVARARAKQALLPLMRGELSKFRDAIRVFESLHADATGLFAGVNGRYVQTLHSLARAPISLSIRQRSRTGPPLLAAPAVHPSPRKNRRYRSRTPCGLSTFPSYVAPSAPMPCPLRRKSFRFTPRLPVGRSLFPARIPSSGTMCDRAAKQAGTTSSEARRPTGKPRQCRVGKMRLSLIASTGTAPTCAWALWQCGLRPETSATAKRPFLFV